jgi:predicted ATP-binding protein involved in virulence
VRIGETNQPILLELVSSGYNNVFGWMGYLLKRLIDVTLEGEDFKKTHAIVLVDEIDTYLHPVWQSRALRVLMDTFPNVQFVVTTHSPYVVGSIPSDRLKIYVCRTQANHQVEVEEFTEFNTYGANLERLSEAVFSTPGRFVTDIQQKMDNLSKLISNGNLDAANSMLANDFLEIDRDDPELARKRTLIKTKQLLAQ